MNNIIAKPDYVKKNNHNKKEKKILSREKNGRKLAHKILHNIKILKYDDNYIYVDFKNIDHMSPLAAWGFISELFSKYNSIELSSKLKILNKNKSISDELLSTSERYLSILYDTYNVYE